MTEGRKKVMINKRGGKGMQEEGGKQINIRKFTK
jgi:hypothetical protein